jgi:hypothetical protein
MRSAFYKKKKRTISMNWLAITIAQCAITINQVDFLRYKKKSNPNPF